ncbi:uncharacterized protein MCYG_03245 [Microsporum canis CBS 113480]|uniref:Uncharacterized protein n=1 Tax=Arthroderma otae (strain ATCC MYA-4605 / CBS 113480) TaxID=554155 RepID=C5FL54_ARTOC|nr:uncharacterized protein MCYG_03245 [Microsporum canis CBS 113480]EEQ30426.1 predicted protein [Microsporum canis CBS 113480]
MLDYCVSTIRYLYKTGERSPANQDGGPLSSGKPSMMVSPWPTDSSWMISLDGAGHAGLEAGESPACSGRDGCKGEGPGRHTSMGEWYTLCHEDGHFG